MVTSHKKGGKKWELKYLKGKQGRNWGVNGKMKDFGKKKRITCEIERTRCHPSLRLYKDLFHHLFSHRSHRQITQPVCLLILAFESSIFSFAKHHGWSAYRRPDLRVQGGLQPLRQGRRWSNFSDPFRFFLCFHFLSGIWFSITIDFRLFVRSVWSLWF